MVIQKLKKKDKVEGERGWNYKIPKNLVLTPSASRHQCVLCGLFCSNYYNYSSLDVDINIYSTIDTHFRISSGYGSDYDMSSFTFVNGYNMKIPLKNNIKNVKYDSEYTDLELLKHIMLIKKTFHLLLYF